ncbi:MAG: cytochrome C biogenesis protein [Cellvibrionaceae bacterium]|nr:cytochrome C biogenesis protein [Cellvibrionaceae bacterium]|tara:strand:+ start:26413 stop:28332 length:1920 start_codon:yes stop_codon:yes gene_type:complete
MPLPILSRNFSFYACLQSLMSNSQRQLNTTLCLLLVLTASSLSQVAHGQFEPAENDWSAAPQNTLDLSGNVSFLPVEQAYRLNANLTPSASGEDALALNWQIADGYYLYQHQLKIEIDGKVLEHALPAAERKYDEYFERELNVYYGSLDLTALLPNTFNRNTTTTVTVHSQGCADAGLCYPPQKQQLQLKDGLATLLATPSRTDTASLSSPFKTEPSNQNLNSDNGSYLWAIIGALLGGLILNLMPCVFPVLSLKALSLVRSGDNPQQQHLHGWAYTAGAVATFVAIAALMLTLRQAGQAVGWGFQLQSPLVVASLAYLFFVLGLSLSGFLQLGNRFAGSGQSLTEGHSYRSSFFTGALATLVASPCTAPFMGGALGYAVTQSSPVALSVFAALGFGMALPFLLLTYFPSLSKRLPTPGAWMETLKQALAFPLYLTALWLLWVVGRQTDSDSVVLIIAGAVGLAFAIWLWQHRPARLWQQCLAAVILAIALWPMAQLQQGQTHTQSTLTQNALAHNWQPFTQARLKQLLDAGQPVFVNLTADWCITCLANEKVALDTDATLKAFEQSGVVKLKGDWTHYNPEITELLAQFGRNGVPLYLLYNGDKRQKPQILPQILREELVIGAIESVKTSNLAAISAK